MLRALRYSIGCVRLHQVHGKNISLNVVRTLSAKAMEPKDPNEHQTDHSHQYGWNAFAATVLGVGLATGVMLYSKFKTSKPKDLNDNSQPRVMESKTEKAPSWVEEQKLLARVPERIPYLIIGAGTAGFSAARSIRAREPTAKVVILGDENYPPYMRPPLSKELWLTPTETAGDAGPIEQPAFLQWNGKARSVYLERSQFYCDLEALASRENGGISVGAGIRVISLNPRRQSVIIMPASAAEDSDAPRREIFYDRCLIATGGKPRIVPQFESQLKSGKISLFRNIDDYKKLTAKADELAEKGGNQSIVVVGGGFLGCELAFALAWRAKQRGEKYTVLQIIRERGVLDHVLPAYLSSWTADRLAEAGVKLVAGVEVASVENIKSGGIKLKLSNGQEISGAHIVLAAGIEPNTQLAEEAGLEIDDKIGGIAVNSELYARNNLWAAGDVSSFYDPRLRARRRVEHHDQAIVSGRLAGENMTGAAKVYSQQAMFWSDLGPSVSFEAVGLIDARLQTYAVFAQQENQKSDSAKPEEFKRGVVFYLSTPKNSGDSRRLIGMLLWNLPGRLGLARRLLKDQPRLDELDGGAERLTEMARMLQLHDDDEELATIDQEVTQPSEDEIVSN